jgi:outer membrane protein assembly factor BamB
LAKRLTGRLRPFLGALLLLTLLPATPAAAAGGDWPTYLGDAARSGSNSSETTLSTANAASMVLRWKFATGGPIAASASVAAGVVYVGAWDGYEYALDAATGAQKWKTNLGTTSGRSGCNPAQAGISSAATVVGSTVYVGGGDANWYALDATTGAVLWSVGTGDNSPNGGHYNWASPLVVGNFAYIGISSFCDNPLVQGQLLKVDLTTHAIVNTFNLVPNGQVGGGIWTSPAYDAATNTIFLTTGTRASATQTMSEALVSLDAGTFATRGVWQLPADQEVSDSDWGDTPVLSTDSSGRALATAVNKNGYAYTFDRNNISPGPLWRSRVAVGGECPTCGDGSVSSGAFDGSRLLLAGGNEEIGASGYPGAVQAFDPGTGTSAWRHGTSSPVVAAIATANGLVFDGAGATFEVLDSATGGRLYSYRTGATIYGSPSVSNGQVYVGSVDGGLYAFGLPASPPGPTAADAGCPAGWTCQDVGAASPPGSETVSGASWSVTSSGAGATGPADAFRSISQPMSGDGQVSGEVTSTPGGAGGQAGLMVRQRAEPGSPYYAVVLKPGNQLVVQHRVGFGGATVTDVTTTAAPPRHLQVRRQGDLFQAATSSDGLSYTLVPGSNVTLPLPDASLGGALAASGTAGTLGTAGFDNVTVAAAGPAATPAPSAGPCPAGWSCADAGNPAVVGDQALSGGTWTLKGGGSDITSYSDQFHFAWQGFSGDVTGSARIQSLTGSGSAKAGVMIRQAQTGTSAEYGAYRQPNGQLIVQYRPQDGLRTSRVVDVAGALPAYIRVARAGDTFTAYTSSDGISYTPVAGSGVSLKMTGTILAGLAVTNASATGLATATIDAVAMSASAPPPPPSCDPAFTCADIGNPTPAGSETSGGGNWTVLAGGNDIWGTGDQFRFDSQALAGDGLVGARVASQSNTSAWAKAGVMLRQDSTPGSAYYDVVLTPGHGIQVQYRSSAGAQARTATTTAGTPPRYLRASRSGSSFTAYTSTDGLTWNPLAGSTVTIAMPGTVLAGLAVTSHNPGQLSTVNFDTIGVGSTTPPPPPGCFSGWTCGDIGNATPGGSQSASGGTWTVQGGGGDIWGTSDQFRYVWQGLPGDGGLSARVASQSNTNAWAKAGLMIRQDPGAGAAEYSALVTPGHGIIVEWRTTLGATTTRTASITGAPPIYVKVARTGSSFSAYTSADGTTWTLVPGSSVSLGISGPALVGLAVTSHNTSSLCSTVFDSVTLT